MRTPNSVGPQTCSPGPGRGKKDGWAKRRSWVCQEDRVAASLKCMIKGYKTHDVLEERVNINVFWNLRGSEAPRKC